MRLPPRERLALERWVKEKFEAVSGEHLASQVPEYRWDRIDPWLYLDLMENAKMTQEHEGGRPVVQVIVPQLDTLELGDTLVGRWPHSDLRMHGFEPTSREEVMDYAASYWGHMFEEDCGDLADLGEVLWIPRGNSNANADNVSVFARLACECGFYVFDVDDRIVLGLEYDALHPFDLHWAPLFRSLTGREVRALVSNEGT